jgi:hypothetical protein
MQAHRFNSRSITKHPQRPRACARISLRNCLLVPSAMKAL